MKCCDCCKPICIRLTHKVISAIGLGLSIAEMIFAGVYNFTFIGFGLAVIGAVGSGLYLWFANAPDGVKDN